MLDITQPIELTHEGILLDKTGRRWEKGTYPANTVPYELTEDVRGKNFEASKDQNYSKVPVIGEVKVATPAPAPAPAPTPTPTPAPTPAPTPTPTPTPAA